MENIYIDIADAQDKAMTKGVDIIVYSRHHEHGLFSCPMTEFTEGIPEAIVYANGDWRILSVKEANRILSGE